MFGKLLYDDPAPSVMFIRFMGAATDIDDDGRITEYVPRGEIVVNVMQIGAVYDHTLLIMGHKIRVMETMDEIMKKLKGAKS